MKKLQLPADRAKRMGIGLFFLAANSFLLSASFLSVSGLRLGEISTRDIRAPKRATYVDQEATDKKRREAASKIFPVYVSSPELTQQNIDMLNLIFKAAASQDRSQKPLSRKKKLSNQLPFDLEDETLRILVHASPETLSILESHARQILSKKLEEGIKEDRQNLEKARLDMAKSVRELQIKGAYKQALRDILSAALVTPNFIVDFEQTKTLKEKAQDSVPPIKHTIEQGEVVVKKGEKITEQSIKKLEALGLTSALFSLRGWLSSLLFSVLLLTLLTLYLRNFQNEVYRNPKSLLLLSLLFVIAMTGVRAIQNALGEGILATMPILAAAFLLGLTFTPSLTVLLSVFLALQSAWSAHNGLQLVLFVSAGVVTLTLCLKDVETRADIFRTAGFVALAGCTVLVAQGLIQATPAMQVAKAAGWGAFAAVFGGILAYGLIYLVERFFGVVTPMQLIEMANPNHPLLRRLMRQAPGTYNHSMYVANLAEAAAQEIQANRLLARAGAYYHDIGKTIRPYLFIENQIHMTNLHESLPPKVSAEYVRCHVSDGIKLGKQYRLPQCILDFIPQHHGTMRISFFYNQLGEEEKGNIEEEEFFYRGPKPQRKETAIVMLADGVEASIRAMAHPTTSDKIEEQVKKIIQNRLSTGQLDESNLTLTDLKKIEKAFLHILNAMYHPRVPYPEASVQESVSP